MIFDSWGGMLADQLYQQFSLNYTRQVVQQLIKEHEGRIVPSIVFTKGGGQWLEQIAACGASAIGLDWTVDLSAARKRVSDSVALQGNLDPMALFGGEAAIRAEVRRVLEAFGEVKRGGHVVNLGHGISQFTQPEAVAVLVDEVRAHSPQFHSP